MTMISDPIMYQYFANYAACPASTARGCFDRSDRSINLNENMSHHVTSPKRLDGVQLAYSARIFQTFTRPLRQTHIVASRPSTHVSSDRVRGFKGSVECLVSITETS